MKVFSKVFAVLAVMLSDIMCAVVAYNYCDKVWGIKYAGYSAPAGVAFLSAIPFAVAIVVCIIVASALKKKANR